MTSVKARVSVVIPTRGRPALVVRAVRSALAQGFEDIEQRVVRVRIIDENLELTLCRNGLKSTGNLRRSGQTENSLAQGHA